MEYEELLNRADMSVRIHDYEEAIKFVRKAIDISQSDSSDKTDKEQNDSEASLYLLLGSIYQKNKEYDKATECYNTTIEKDPHCVEAYNNLGVIAKNTLDFKSAVEFFKQALLVNPNRADIYYNLGNAYKLMDNKEYAKDNFEQTLKLKPDYVSAYNNLGNILDSLEQYQYALAVYQKGLKIDLNNWKIHYNIAITFEKIGNIAEAESHYRKAIEINPTFIEAYNNLGILYEKNGNYDAAKKCYHDLLSFNPDCAKAHNNLGRIYEHINRPNDAFSEYEKALENNPDYITALNNGARLSYEQQNYKKAEKLYEHLLSLNENNYSTRIRLANIKEETAPNEALSLYKTLIDKNENPDDLPALHKHIGDTYAKLDMNENALEHYKIVRQMANNDTDNMMRMAKLSEKIGLLHDAVAILEEAKKTDSNNPEIMKSLGEAYMHSGENEKAIETLKTLQEIAPDKKNIYNLALASKDSGHSEEALGYMNELLSTSGDGSLLDLDNLTEKLNTYEEMLSELAAKSAEGNNAVLNILDNYTLDELLAPPKKEKEQNKSDMLSELEESLIAESEDGKLISFGDNAPVYDVEEEEEILDASDAEEDTEQSDSILNLLKGEDTYDEMVYRKEEKKPEPEIPPPKPPNPYEGLPPPTINVTAENSIEDDHLLRLENAILQLTEQIVNLMKGNPEIYGGLPLADENEQLKQQIEELTQKLEDSDNSSEPEFASFEDLDKQDDEYEFASYEDLDEADNAMKAENSSGDENLAEEDDSDDENAADTEVNISDDGEELIFAEEDDDDDYDESSSDEEKSSGDENISADGKSSADENAADSKMNIISDYADSPSTEDEAGHSARRVANNQTSPKTDRPTMPSEMKIKTIKINDILIDIIE